MRNPVYEQFLTSQGVKWRYLEKVELSSIDSKRSLANQARLEQALDTDLIAQYRSRYRKGDQFPPLVVHRPAKKFVLLDGNQRLHACGPVPGWKGLRFHDAYLVDSGDEAVLNRIAWTINDGVNGKRMTYEDNLQHAVTYVRKYNWSAKQAADEFSVPHKVVWVFVRREELKDKLREQGVNRLPSDPIIDYTGALAGLGDDIFAQSARVLTGIGAAASDAQDLVKKVRKAKTHADKLAVIGEYESSDYAQDRKAQTKCGTIRPRSPMARERLRRYLTEARNIMEDNPIKSVMLPVQPADKKEAKSLAADVVRLLINLYGPQILNELKEESA